MNVEKFNFNGLLILDLANNHQGDLEHGLSIIQSLGQVIREFDVRVALKFQFRQLDSFIHPSYRERDDIPHIPRFTSTRLPLEDYKTMIAEARSQGMLTMCTPFDEESVDIIQAMDIDLMKIASCSLSDWPLVERVASASMPTAISTGGASFQDIDTAVRLLEATNHQIGLHHCVSIYPTPPEKMQLNQIELLKRRYRKCAIGWSTHEDPDDTITVQLALSKGAVFFERHVGMRSNKYELNKYSSTPEQVRNWIMGLLSAQKKLGALNRFPPTADERKALDSLKRGVFARRDIKLGETINRSDIFFAAPLIKGGLSSGDWQQRVTATRDIDKNEPLLEESAAKIISEEQRIEEIMLQVRGMLYDSQVSVNPESRVEISHHYGLERFREFGAVIIDVINREYCKKLIIQLPRQKHPYHYHEKKEETFQVLYGDLEVERDGEPFILKNGDLFLVEPGKWHKFSTLHGVIFEEISTTHFDNDSYYADELISRLPRSARKTRIEHWSS